MMKQVRWNKKRRWIDTRYCKPFVRRAALKRLMAAQVAAAAGHSIRVMSSHLAEGPAEQCAKSIAIANTVAGAFNAINSIMEKTK